MRVLAIRIFISGTRPAMLRQLVVGPFGVRFPAPERRHSIANAVCKFLRRQQSVEGQRRPTRAERHGGPPHQVTFSSAEVVRATTLFPAAAGRIAAAKTCTRC